MNRTILLVEDDTDLLINNKEYLMRRGYRVLTAETLKDASGLLAREQPDLMLLDVNMPDGSGLDFIEQIRETNDVPVIFLTCRTDKADIIDGLTRGGCDYITKPFDLDVMFARMEAQFRKMTPQMKLTRGPLTLDLAAQQAYLNGMDILLPPKRFALLRLFIEHENETMNAAYLYEEVWKTPMNADDRAVRFQISRLRAELSGSGYTVTNKRGEGYCFERE